MTEVDVAKLRDRDVLWQALDWTFWGVGMGDTFREPLADKMIATLTVEEFEKAQVLIRQWNDYRGGPHERNLFIEIKAERDAAIARAERAEAAIERVREMHKKVEVFAGADFRPLTECSRCGDDEPYVYPCATVVALDKEEEK